MGLDGVQIFLDNCPNFVALDDGEEFTIRWSQPGVGFGGFYIWEEDGATFIESESMSKEFIKKILCQLVDEAQITD